MTKEVENVFGDVFGNTTTQETQEGELLALRDEIKALKGAAASHVESH